MNEQRVLDSLVDAYWAFMKKKDGKRLLRQALRDAYLSGKADKVMELHKVLEVRIPSHSDDYL